MSRRHAITFASCACASRATSSLTPVGSAARAVELAHPRERATKRRLRVLDVLTLGLSRWAFLLVSSADMADSGPRTFNGFSGLAQPRPGSRSGLYLANVTSPSWP